MTPTTIALTLGIIAAITVIVAMCCIIVGAASDPLSQFDSPYQRSRDGKAEGAIAQRIKRERSNHHAVPNSTRMDV